MIDRGDEPDTFTTFVISPDPIYGISGVVYDSLSFLNSIDRLSRFGYSNTYHLNVSRQTPLELMEGLPVGSVETFMRLGEVFLDELETIN